MKTGKLIYESPSGMKVYDREDSHLHIPDEVLHQALEDYGLERSDMNGGDSASKKKITWI